MNSVDGSARGRLLEHRALKSFPRAKGLECGTLWQIQSFIAVAEAGSITLAADRINISQPSISTAIAHLEQELDVQPFVRRHAQSLMLTAVGKTLLIEAKRLIERAEQLYAVASEITNDVRGRLSLGCMVTLAPMIMPELSHFFTTAYPGTNLVHVVDDHDSLLQKLASAEIDVAVTYDLLVPGRVDFTPLASLPPLYLWEKPTRLHRCRRSPWRRRPPSLLHAGVDPQIGARSPHQDILRTMVANGYGYTLQRAAPADRAWIGDTEVSDRKIASAAETRQPASRVAR